MLLAAILILQLFMVPISSEAGEIKEYKTPYTTFHLDEEMIETSKPPMLSTLDFILLKKVGIQVGNCRTYFLVNRITDQVEYVYVNGMGRFIKSKFIMPNAQEEYKKYKNARIRKRKR